jgi:hypothetical protein
MANKEQLAILMRGGVRAWNAWRTQYPDEVLDLCPADL